jgi:hypothetical protein
VGGDEAEDEDDDEDDDDEDEDMPALEGDEAESSKAKIQEV